MTKCPSCGTDSDEYQSMIGYFISLCIREVICEMVDKKLNLGVSNVRRELIQFLKDEQDAPENIRMWFERMI